MDDLQVLILAAGKSTRMKSKYAKVLHRVGGRSLIDHVVRAARSATGNISVVIGHSADAVRAAVPEVKFVEQKQQLGTGHAVLAARESFSGYSGDVLVMPGDVPLISPGDAGRVYPVSSRWRFSCIRVDGGSRKSRGVRPHRPAK